MAKKNAIVSNFLKSPKFFDELPTKTFEKTSKYVEILDAVKKSKKWALIATFDKSSAANGVAGYLRKYPAILPGRFEFATRNLGDEGTGLFAKFVGK